MLFIILRFQNLQIEKYLISQKFNGTNYPIIPTAQSDFLNENIWVEFRCFAFHFNSTIRNLDSFYRIHWPSFSCFYDPPYMNRMHITDYGGPITLTYCSRILLTIQNIVIFCFHAI